MYIYFFTSETFVGKKGEATGTYSEMMLRVPQELRKMSVSKGKERVDTISLRLGRRTAVSMEAEMCTLFVGSDLGKWQTSEHTAQCRVRCQPLPLLPAFL